MVAGATHLVLRVHYGAIFTLVCGVDGVEAFLVGALCLRAGENAGLLVGVNGRGALVLLPLRVMPETTVLVMSLLFVRLLFHRKALLLEAFAALGGSGFSRFLYYLPRLVKVHRLLLILLFLNLVQLLLSSLAHFISLHLLQGLKVQSVGFLLGEELLVGFGAFVTENGLGWVSLISGEHRGRRQTLTLHSHL